MRDYKIYYSKKMVQKILLKKDLPKFLEVLIKKYEVIAPVKKEVTKFEVIKSPEEVWLEGITQIPVKNFFIPEGEELFSFENNKIIEKNKNKEGYRIVFGLRLCDINALKILDKVMFDPAYIKRRKKTIIIGIYCDKPDKYCFCNSMDLKDEGWDLFFYPTLRKYYISIGSKKGYNLVKDLPNARKVVVKKIKNKKVLRDKNIEGDYRNEIWDSDAEKCLSCGACTVYCPTCNCFDILDEQEIDLKKGKRIRKAASCQLKSFSEVAGGKVFRESRKSRFKHFVYHKLVYYKKRYGRYMCVGCGRCLRVCPTKIDWVETINLLKSFKK